MMQSLPLFGIKISPGSVADLCTELSRLIRQDRPAIIIDANIHGVNLAWQIPWLADMYRQADIVYVDGAGIVLGAKILGYTIPPRLTMADLGWPVARHLAREGHSLFLLGNPPGVADQAAAQLRRHAPGLQVVGTQHGFFAKTGPDNDAVIAAINRARPDILMVGMGMPLEQSWIHANRERLQARVFWTVGAAFQYWAGVIPRCPVWMRRFGFEWLARFLYEPRRLAQRYLWGNTLFLARVLALRWKLLQA